IPQLPTTSTNGITGTWSPAINNTQTTTYTFTPDDGQCATTTTLQIVIEPNVTPTFAAVGTYCNGAAIPALPTTSINGITGTWSPAINKTQTATYTFTPDDGQCATTTTLQIVIEPNVTPTFAAVGTYCNGAAIPALPTTSINGITGTWSPAIDNTQTTTYTFTPNDGQCATTTTVQIVISDNVVPTFDPMGALCQNSAAPAVAAVSNNGITGTWNPAVIKTANVGITPCTGSPDAGQCAVSTTLEGTIALHITPVFTQIGSLCMGETAP